MGIAAVPDGPDVPDEPEIPNPGEVNGKRCPTIGTVNQIFLKNSLMKFLI